MEPTKHQYDHDAAAVHGFLLQFGLEKEIKLNIEANHATLAGHSFQHELAYAVANDLLGSVDANRGDPQNGWDTDQFPNSADETDAGALHDPAGRRLHHRRLQLRRQAAPPERRRPTTCSTRTSAAWTRSPAACCAPRRMIEHGDLARLVARALRRLGRRPRPRHPRRPARRLADLERHVLDARHRTAAALGPAGDAGEPGQSGCASDVTNEHEWPRWARSPTSLPHPALIYRKVEAVGLGFVFIRGHSCSSVAQARDPLLPRSTHHLGAGARGLPPRRTRVAVLEQQQPPRRGGELRRVLGWARVEVEGAGHRVAAGRQRRMIGGREGGEEGAIEVGLRAAAVEAAAGQQQRRRDRLRAGCRRAAARCRRRGRRRPRPPGRSARGRRRRRRAAAPASRRRRAAARDSPWPVKSTPMTRPGHCGASSRQSALEPPSACSSSSGRPSPCASSCSAIAVRA